MAKYARRLNQIPKLWATTQSVCVGVYAHLSEWLCVCTRMCACIWCITRVAWSDSPAGPLPLSKRRGEKLCQLFFYHIPAISFSDRLRLFTGAKIQDSVILPDVCPGQTAHLAFSIRSTWCTASCVCICLRCFFQVSLVTSTLHL